MQIWQSIHNHQDGNSIWSKTNFGPTGHPHINPLPCICTVPSASVIFFKMHPGSRVYDSASIMSIVLKWMLLSQENREKLKGVKLGEQGGWRITVMLFLVKKIPLWKRKCETVYCRQSSGEGLCTFSCTHLVCPEVSMQFKHLSMALAFFSEHLSNHCQVLCQTLSKICR
jgi:hypothetical protein